MANPFFYTRYLHIDDRKKPAGEQAKVGAKIRGCYFGRQEIRLFAFRLANSRPVWK